MNVEIKRFSDSDEDFTKATECHKKAVLRGQAEMPVHEFLEKC